MIFLQKTKFWAYFFIFAVIAFIGFFIFNADRGIDLTDESYYILSSIRPFDVFQNLSYFHFYTGMLFYASGYNLAIFRIMGLILFLLSTLFFANELYRYIKKQFNLNYSTDENILFVSIVILSTFCYYFGFWSLTPSYNWLAGISMICVAGFMFRIVSKYELILGKIFIFEYVMLGFVLCILFFAKPTSLLGLFPLIILFLIFNCKSIDFIRSISAIFVIFVLSVLIHIYFLGNGVAAYYLRLKESFELLNILGGGHDLLRVISHFFIQLAKVVQYNVKIVFIFLICFLVFLKVKKTIFFINALLLFLVVAFCLLYNFSGLYIFTIFFMIAIFIMYVKTELLLVLNFKKEIKELIIVVFLVASLALSVSFGTNNNIWSHSSIYFVFPVAAIMCLVFVLDKLSNTIKHLKIYSGLSIVLIVCCCCFYGYQNPYRLNTSIFYQTNHIGLFGGIKVDGDQKKYLDQLLNISYKNNVKFLIDMTGHTPGANIFLQANFFKYPWLLGGYFGSDNFAFKILNNVKYENLKDAWILTSNTERSLNVDILNKMGLVFPGKYIKVDTLYVKSRNEIQELWRPTF